MTAMTYVTSQPQGTIVLCALCNTLHLHRPEGTAMRFAEAALNCHICMGAVAVAPREQTPLRVLSLQACPELI